MSIGVFDDRFKITSTYGYDTWDRGDEVWIWYPGYRNLYFIHRWQTITVCSSSQDPSELDTFRCRAHTVAGRLRACRRWIEATYWEQPPLWDDLPSFVKSET